MYTNALLQKVFSLADGKLSDIAHISLHRLSAINTKLIAYDSQGVCFKIVVFSDLLDKETVYDAFQEIYDEKAMLKMIERGQVELKKPFRQFLEVNLDSEDLATVPVPKRVTNKVFETLQKQEKPVESEKVNYLIYDFENIGLRFIALKGTKDLVMVIFYDHISKALQEVYYLADVNEVPIESLRNLKADLKEYYVTEL